MTGTHSDFVGSIPAIYDRHLGPLFFEFTAADLAARVSAVVPHGARVLEVACGTGISTEQLRAQLSDHAEIVATDLNQSMIDFAMATRGGLANVSWRTADALALPFAADAFDGLICQFGIMFFPDKAKGLGEMAHVLKPGGLLAFNVWDSFDHNRAAAIAHETIARYFDDEPPAFLQVPFGFAAIDPIKDLLHEAGFRKIGIDVVAATIERPDAHHVARGLVEGNPGILEIRERATADAETIVQALAGELQRAFGPAPLKIPLQEIVFTAVKPD